MVRLSPTYTWFGRAHPTDKRVSTTYILCLPLPAPMSTSVVPAQQNMTDMATKRVKDALVPDFDPEPVVVRQPNLDKPKKPLRWKLWMSTLLISFIYAAPTGFHYVVLNNSKHVIEDWMVTHLPAFFLGELRISAVWSAVNAAMAIGCVVGSFFASYFCDKIGRKPTLMYISNIVALVGNLCLYAAKPMSQWSLLLVGRFVTGMGAGISQTALGLYLMECAPVDVAGVVGSFVDTFLSLAMLFAHLLATEHALGTPDLWPYLISACGWMAIIGVVISPCLPESPKHLLVRNGDIMAAQRSISFFAGLSYSHPEVCATARTMHRLESGGSGDLSWIQAWKQYPRVLGISSMLGVGAVLCGHIALQSYSTQMLVLAGMPLATAQIETIIMGAFETAGGFAAPVINLNSSRREVLLTTLMVCALGNALVFACYRIDYALHEPRILFAATSAAMIVVFSAIMGPFSLRPIVASELAPHAVRAKCCTLAMAATQAACIIVQWGSWPLYNLVREYLFLIFSITTSMAIIYFFIVFPKDGAEESKISVGGNDYVLVPTAEGPSDDDVATEDEDWRNNIQGMEGM